MIRLRRIGAGHYRTICGKFEVIRHPGDVEWPWTLYLTEGDTPIWTMGNRIAHHPAFPTLREARMGLSQALEGKYIE